MKSTFEEEVAPFRRELLAHCYRITGSLADAEDALQEALVRAWKGRENFRGESTLRRWLYTIATRTCLDLLADRKGRRILEEGAGALPSSPAAMPPPILDGRTWIEPALDDALGLAVDPLPLPDARLSARESVRLAFLAALQQLPAKQRAALILRDVVGLSAEETAAVLELSVPAVNSALQRARETVDAGAPAPAKNDDVEVDALLSRFVRALEASDATALAALLHQDVVYAMPPIPLWLRGRDVVVALHERVIFANGPLTITRTRANGAHALQLQQQGKPLALVVVEAAEGAGAVSFCCAFLSL